jgi:hypothetical protein
MDYDSDAMSDTSLLARPMYNKDSFVKESGSEIVNHVSKEYYWSNTDNKDSKGGIELLEELLELAKTNSKTWQGLIHTIDLPLRDLLQENNKIDQEKKKRLIKTIKGFPEGQKIVIDISHTDSVHFNQAKVLITELAKTRPTKIIMNGELFPEKSKTPIQNKKDHNLALEEQLYANNLGSKVLNVKSIFESTGSESERNRELRKLFKASLIQNRWSSLTIHGIESKRAYKEVHNALGDTKSYQGELIMSGDWISKPITPNEIKGNRDLENINSMISEVHDSQTYDLWKRQARTDGNKSRAKKESIRMDYLDKSFSNGLAPKDLIAISKDILNDESFKKEFPEILNQNLPEPFVNMEDYLDSISLYSKDETVYEFVKDLVKLHKSLNKKEIKELEQKVEGSEGYKEEGLRDELSELKDPYIIEFKTKHPKFFNPNSLIETANTKSNQKVLRNIVVATATLYGVMGALKPASASKLDLPPQDELFNALPEGLATLSRAVEEGAKYATTLVTSAKVSDVNTPDVFVPLLVTLFGLMLDKTILSKMSKDGYKDIQSKNLKSNQQNLNNALNFLKNSLKNPLVLTGVSVLSGGLYPVAAVCLINSVEARNTREMQNRISIPKSHLHYSNCINQHKKDAIDALDSNPSTRRKKEGGENPQDRTVLLRMISHEFANLTDNQQMQNLEGKLNDLSRKINESNGEYSEEIIGEMGREYDQLNLELQKHKNNLDGSFKVETRMPEEDIARIKNIKSSTFEEPLRTLILNFRRSAGVNVNSDLTVGELSGIQINNWLETADFAQLPRSSVIREKNSKGKNMLAIMIKRISSPNGYRHVEDMKRAALEVEEANKILKEASENITLTTSVEEMNFIKFTNPTAIFEANVRKAVIRDKSIRGMNQLNSKSQVPALIDTDEKKDRQDIQLEVDGYMKLLKTIHPSTSQKTISQNIQGLKHFSKEKYNQLKKMGNRVVSNPMGEFKKLSKALKGLKMDHLTAKIKQLSNTANRAVIKKATEARDNLKYDFQKIALPERARIKKDLINRENAKKEEWLEPVKESWKSESKIKLRNFKKTMHNSDLVRSIQEASEKIKNTLHLVTPQKEEDVVSKAPPTIAR